MESGEVTWNINNNMFTIICLKGIFRLQLLTLSSQITLHRLINSKHGKGTLSPLKNKVWWCFCFASAAKKIAFDSDWHSFLQSWHNHMLKKKKMCTLGEQVPRFEPKVKAIKLKGVVFLPGSRLQRWVCVLRILNLGSL